MEPFGGCSHQTSRMHSLPTSYTAGPYAHVAIGAMAVIVHRSPEAFGTEGESWLPAAVTELRKED